MDYKLKSANGRVKYIMKQKTCNVCTDTRLDSVEWMLREHAPHRSDEFDGYPIAVNCNGSEYFFEGEWPVRRRKRMKDIVCE